MYNERVEQITVGLKFLPNLKNPTFSLNLVDPVVINCAAYNCFNAITDIIHFTADWLPPCYGWLYTCRNLPQLNQRCCNTGEEIVYDRYCPTSQPTCCKRIWKGGCQKLSPAAYVNNQPDFRLRNGFNMNTLFYKHLCSF